MSIVTITTGPEGREFNGPLMPPIWNGTDEGFREGQIYYDITGVLDGDPGPIYWDGDEWKKYASGIATTPTLDAVTTVGNSTLNGINVGYCQAQSPGGTPQLSCLAEGSTAILQAGPDPDNPGTFVSDLILQGDTNRLLLPETGSLVVRTVTTQTQIIEINNDGRVTGAAATGANDFVVLSQIRRSFIYSTATTLPVILDLSTVNSLFANYDDVQVTNVTDATPNSIYLKRTGATTWDYIIMNKLT